MKVLGLLENVPRVVTPGGYDRGRNYEELGDKRVSVDDRNDAV